MVAPTPSGHRCFAVAHNSLQTYGSRLGSENALKRKRLPGVGRSMSDNEEDRRVSVGVSYWAPLPDRGFGSRSDHTYSQSPYTVCQEAWWETGDWPALSESPGRQASWHTGPDQ